ncbi:MAG: maleylpyruvate isomerase family mycothiol-dependent enzyme [Acidimicrobiales bacterium]
MAPSTVDDERNGVRMASRQSTIENLTQCFDDLETLIGSLADDEWAVQSLCPDWTVRGVVTHLVGVEHALGGWLPATEGEPPPFHKVGEFVTDSVSWSNAELVARTADILDVRRRDLAATTDDDFARAAMTPVGPGTYHRFMEIRVFDFWVHQRDMTTPLGRATSDGGPSAVVAVDEVDRSIGYIVGKKIGLPDGMSIAFHLTGPVERDICVAVVGRATRVETLDAPSVEVTTDSLTFVQLACGRLDPQAVIDAGRITWTGDPTWGDRAARNLTFTM